MISDKFIHVHVPKTAGQLIRMLIAYRRKHWKFLIEDTHIKLSEAKIKLAEQAPKFNIDINSVPSFVFVRNPWEYFVSRYFQRQRDIENEQQYIIVERMGNSIEGFQKHMYLLAEIAEKTDISQSIAQYILKDDGLPACGRTFQYLSIGTWHYQLVDEKVDFVGRFENLIEDLKSILLKVAPNVFTIQEIEVKKDSLVNKSTHEHYSKYYNAELRDLVAKWDAKYIAEFNYDFEEVK